MTNPIVADNKPTKVVLEKVKNTIFVHVVVRQSSRFVMVRMPVPIFHPKPLQLKVMECLPCACKHSKNTPFCDGSHKQFTAEEVGSEGTGVQIVTVDEMPEATPTSEEPTVAYIHQLARGIIKTRASQPNDINVFR